MASLFSAASCTQGNYTVNAQLNRRGMCLDLPGSFDILSMGHEDGGPAPAVGRANPPSPAHSVEVVHHGVREIKQHHMGHLGGILYICNSLCIF